MEVTLQDFISNVAKGHKTITELLERQGGATRDVIAKEGQNTRNQFDVQFQASRVEGAAESNRQGLLGSLEHRNMNARRNDIKDRHAGTFERAFDDSPHRPWDSLTQFLRADAAIYWIQGKAGSGKSCFIKLLCNNPRTINALNEWQPGKQPILLSYFFWLSHSLFERSSRRFWSTRRFWSSLLFQLLE